MKKEILIILFAIICQQSFSQINIKGKIIDEKQNIIPGATISFDIEEKKEGTISNENGEFNFVLQKTGTYEVKISYVGFYVINKTYDFLENKEYDLGTITLKEDVLQLQTVEVVGRTKRDYNSDYSFSATKMAIANKELPQAIASVTKELIADRQAFHLADAVKVVSGVSPSSFYNQYNIRGISQNEEGQIINGMRTRQFYFLQPLTSNIERVEVIKGPASATFASVDPGGSINMVTKKPLSVDRKEVSLSVGSFSTMRGSLDFTGPLNESKTLLYRINGAYQTAQSYRDLISNKSILLSPSFSYIPNEKTAINAEFIFNNMNGNLDRGQPIFGAVAGQTNLNSTPISLNLGASSDFFKSKEVIIMGNLSHKFSPNITFNTSYMKQTWTEDLQEHRTTNTFAVDIANEPIPSLVAMRFVQRKQFWSIDNVNSYFNFDFKTGSIDHKLLVGYDLHYWKKLKGGGQNSARGYLLNDGSVTRSFDPANASDYQTITIGGSTLPKPNVNHFDLANPSYTIQNIQDYTINSRIAVPSALTMSNAVYIQEQLKWNKFSLLLSLRNEWFEDITHYKTANESSFTNQRLLPRIGITYAVNDNINVYGTYLEGFQPQSNTVTLLPSTGQFFWADESASRFKPLTSDLKEIGMKADLFNKKITMNMAIYEINQKNILMSANDPTQPDLLVQRGADRSRGFEWDMAGYLLPNWQINASYSYIDAIIVTDADVTLEGARKENVPKHSANLWTRYNFDNGSILRDLGIGFGVQHQGSKVPWFTRDFEVPASTIFDAALYYTPTKSNLQVAVNVGNLFDETYWLGAQTYTRLFPGAPRNITLTTTYKF
ncbi:iron complex outermembrane receptor protein [Aquimarina sp. EL_43]|uniref:TonB-dependent receptor n=1 Tax=unclassified Aquimarina TaxID=2627091 RepID=UPI0018C9E380|nr:MULTISPECIES: TonB-dependent receptor [unclassified Aquimarina]MBG6128972.1 iron complex outermembrane receptor protein [Aquimarina sp. EL_35]MBG6150036.1 iron complex outermembrane receptor protein [Aquimarina sp. EL_32]MBG6167277.1 iron complex outermembrane receptor protein [Aquimarina sp. EL_43]